MAMLSWQLFLEYFTPQNRQNKMRSQGFTRHISPDTQLLLLLKNRDFERDEQSISMSLIFPGVYENQIVNSVF